MLFVTVTSPLVARISELINYREGTSRMKVVAILEPPSQNPRAATADPL